MNEKKPMQVTSDPSCTPERLDLLLQIILCMICGCVLDSKMPSIQKGKEKLCKHIH